MVQIQDNLQFNIPRRGRSGRRQERVRVGSGSASPVIDSINKPSVGMLFKSWEEAYGYYRAYAIASGFELLKVTRSTLKEQLVEFRCAHRTRGAGRKKLQFKSCEASISLMLQKNGSFMLTNFNDKHCHGLGCDSDTPIGGVKGSKKQQPTLDSSNKPYLGMTFKSSEEAHGYYKAYAIALGFKLVNVTRSTLQEQLVEFRCAHRTRGACIVKSQGKKLKHPFKSCEAGISLMLQNDGSFMLNELNDKHCHVLNCDGDTPIGGVKGSKKQQPKGRGGKMKRNSSTRTDFVVPTRMTADKRREINTKGLDKTSATANVNEKQPTPNKKKQPVSKRSTGTGEKGRLNVEMKTGGEPERDQYQQHDRGKSLNQDEKSELDQLLSEIQATERELAKQTIVAEETEKEASEAALKAANAKAIVRSLGDRLATLRECLIQTLKQQNEQYMAQVSASGTSTRKKGKSWRFQADGK